MEYWLIFGFKIHVRMCEGICTGVQGRRNMNTEVVEGLACGLHEYHSKEICIIECIITTCSKEMIRINCHET